MALLQNWLPPSRENWSLMVTIFSYFPVISAMQWLTPYYPMGKTSTASRLNVPGKMAWVLMELPAPMLLVYTMVSLRRELPPPRWENLVLAGAYVTHYLYRSLLSPFLNPSMSPIHPTFILGSWLFNTLNPISLGGHLAGLPLNPPTPNLLLGLPIWALGFVGTITHDEILRCLRRPTTAQNKNASTAAPTHTIPNGHGGTKTYVLPNQGLFRWILSPHYLCEWIEWVGFYIATGGSAPARNFVVAEVAVMFPRALAVRRWYAERFREAKGRWAIFPGIV